MLNHPWLKMPDDYSFKMTDLEYKKYNLKQKIDVVNEQHLKKDKFVTKHGSGPQNYHRDGDDYNVSDLADSDEDINGADCEDNISDDSDFSDQDSLSLTGEKDDGEAEEEFNLNVSFSGGYVPNTDLSRVDKGQGNPQFSGLEIKV